MYITYKKIRSVFSPLGACLQTTGRIGIRLYYVRLYYVRYNVSEQWHLDFFGLSAPTVSQSITLTCWNWRMNTYGNAQSAGMQLPLTFLKNLFLPPFSWF